MNYRNTRNAYLNCEKRVYPGAGPYDIPMMLPVYEVQTSGLGSVGFNYFLTEKHPEDKILHFFLDDYQFIRVWNDPDRYVSKLARFRYVVAPDFSLYIDHPKAVQIFNHYRKHWISRYWQEHGVTVIPCICWSDEESFEWCFDGTPKHAAVCVSTVGGFGNHECDKEAWLKGYRKCLEVLEPSQVILFGKEYEDVRTSVPTQVINNEQLARKRTLSHRSNDENGVSILEVDMHAEIESEVACAGQL